MWVVVEDVDWHVEVLGHGPQLDRFELGLGGELDQLLDGHQSFGGDASHDRFFAFHGGRGGVGSADAPFFVHELVGEGGVSLSPAEPVVEDDLIASPQAPDPVGEPAHDEGEVLSCS